MASQVEVEDQLSKVLQELEEARIRGCQMEKTVRWWTSCTTSWRRKWNKAHREKDTFKRESNTLRSRLSNVLKEIQNISEQASNDTNITVVKHKLDSLLAEHKSHMNCHIPTSSTNNEKPNDDDDEMDNMVVPDCPASDNKGLADTRVQAKYRVTRELLDTEIEKNESLVGIMTQELASVVAEKKKLHMEIENLKSEKIILKQELRVRNLEVDTMKEQLRIIKNPIKKTELPVAPERDYEILTIENSALRSQVRDLCEEVSVAQEEIDKVSAELNQLSKRNEEFLDHKETCKKEIERLNLRLQGCGFYSDEDVGKHE